MVDDEVTIVKVPPFAESLTEGDIRWDKGKLVEENPKLMKYSPVFPFLIFSRWRLSEGGRSNRRN